MRESSIIDRFDHELVPIGFRRSKTTWNREQCSSVEVVDIQSSKDGSAVTINVGVLSRSVYFACWGRDAGEFIEEPFCTVRARVGQLLDNKDRWWDVRSTGVVDEMTDCLREQIFPFLERMRSLEGMRDWLALNGMPSSKSPLSSICFAVLLSQLGDTSTACTTLSELERKVLGAWKFRVREVAERIGCESVLRN